MILDVVIVSYNGRRLLQACLESLRVAAQSTRLRIIVVDNASRDGAAAMVRDRYPEVALIENGSNVGFARAVNIGLRRTHADYILLLNPDTEVPSGTLDACVAALNERPNVGALGCKLIKADGTLDHACKRGFPTPRSALAYFSPFDIRWRGSTAAQSYTAAHIDEDEEGYVDAINGAFMLIRREALDDVGLLDEDYWMYGEDLDWCYRLHQKGWPILYWPRAVVLHVKAGITGKRRSPRTNLAFHHSMWLFYSKHYAPYNNVILTAGVWCAIWTKLGASIALNAVSTVRSTRRRDGL
jgi:GT2 family glycosyltransferase